jgi:hypothetical protein
MVDISTSGPQARAISESSARGQWHERRGLVFQEMSNSITRPDSRSRAQFVAAEALDQLIRLN